ncbi:hypothetical protein QNK01_10940 [Desemzia incerta]|uniref:TolB family protein n=1 Tax=Desemzia incerta TaxID=82801 RepID=UPI0024C2D720|nr:hypothetical protein [Desemzia incerta]WHZ31949.1 hypothetical protein QNK01_10940 [Desemzia incerta]
MAIEKKVNQLLSKFPFVKKTVKRMYQLFFYSISSKNKKLGNIERISPNDEYEYFFGYYDKSPWDVTNRYMLSLKVLDTSKSTAPKTKADILLIDTHNNNKVKKVASTNTWNVQQGCMVQWLGPNFDEEIIYNDFQNGEYCSVILNIKTNEKRIIEKPVYSVSSDGKWAITLDFSRLHRLREGYGYSNKEDLTKNEKIPNSPAIWKIDLDKNESKPLLNYTDFYNFQTTSSMKGAEHKVNHIMINPSGTRFMVLHRWLNGGDKFTRLVTVDMNGENLFNLNDDKMTSHCYWKNDQEIIAYANKAELGTGYYLFNDQTSEFKRVLDKLKNDGHPSYSPNNEYILTDTYPDKARMASIYLASKNEVKTIARVFAPFKYDNELRCDLHPRWSRDGKQISFDSVFEGKRRLYTIDISKK